MNELTKDKIRTLLLEVMNRIIDKRVITEPFIEEHIYQKNPFGGRLVPTEIWKGSKFERSFVTSLGQGIFEQIAKIIAEGSGAAVVENQHRETFSINTFRNARINEILSAQRSRETTTSPDWDVEVRSILQLNYIDQTQVTIISDLYVERDSDIKEYYSMKTVKPNLDQTEIAKRDMLRIKAFNPSYEAYFALPFNPAGEGNIYRTSGHSIPYRLFQMDQDCCVLIGGAFWNKVGNDENTYSELLTIFSEVGEVTSVRIRKEYLEIE